MTAKARRADLSCPSAQPEMPGARAFGVVLHHEDTTVGYLEEAVPVTPELLAMAGGVRPTEVFRIAAPCQTSRCEHWSHEQCSLVDRIVGLVPAASLKLPACAVRKDCRWYAQRGRAACVRCPSVVTQNEWPSETMREAAAPPSRDAKG